MYKPKLAASLSERLQTIYTACKDETSEWTQAGQRRKNGRRIPRGCRAASFEDAGDIDDSSSQGTIGHSKRIQKKGRTFNDEPLNDEVATDYSSCKLSQRSFNWNCSGDDRQEESSSIDDDALYYERMVFMAP